MTMDQIPGGDLTGWAAMLASVAGGFLWLRRYLTGDAAERVSNNAYATTIAMLQSQNEVLMKALEDERRGRAEAHAKINELTNHIFQLEIQVRRMRQQLDEIAPRSDTLQTGPTP
jgi:chromosome segregation ATPase